MTGKILHKPAIQNTGYSKLSSTAHVPETDQSQARHAAKSGASRTADPGRKKRERNRRLATKLFNKATCPDWLWTEDRQLKRTVYTEIQALSGRTFTLDAVANDDGSNAHCTEFCSHPVISLT